MAGALGFTCAYFVAWFLPSPAGLFLAALLFSLTSCYTCDLVPRYACDQRVLERLEYLLFKSTKSLFSRIVQEVRLE